jgi:TonB-dependent receptor
MVQVKYLLEENTNLRAAFTRSFARPNFSDLPPYNLTLEEDRELYLGNPDLDPTLSWNFDLMAEHFFPSVGVVSGGFFYKKLNDYIYNFRYEQEIDGETYEVFQPLNGESAELWGLELAIQNQFRFLPSPLDGIGVFANYTWTDSTAKFPDREGDDSPLPGQSEHMANFAVSYEKWGFSSLLSVNYHGKYIDSVGETAIEDIYYDNHLRMDLSVAYQINRNWRIYAQFNNLTNEPLRYYEGTTNRPVQEEYYRWWAMFGVSYDFGN